MGVIARRVFLSVSWKAREIVEIFIISTPSRSENRECELVRYSVSNFCLGSQCISERDGDEGL